MGIVAPIGKDPPPPPGSARITFQLHAHTYTSSVKLHYNTTKTQTTTTTITIHITPFGMFRGGGSSHKYQSLWSFTQKIMEYQWVCCHLLSPYLIHPTLVLRFPPSPTARTSRTRSRRSHFLFFITGTCCLFVLHHWKTQVRYPLLHHWKTLLLSPICIIGSLTAFTSGPSSICGKQFF